MINVVNVGSTRDLPCVHLSECQLGQFPCFKEMQETFIGCGRWNLKLVAWNVSLVDSCYVRQDFSGFIVASVPSNHRTDSGISLRTKFRLDYAELHEVSACDVIMHKAY